MKIEPGLIAMQQRPGSNSVYGVSVNWHCFLVSLCLPKLVRFSFLSGTTDKSGFFRLASKLCLCEYIVKCLLAIEDAVKREFGAFPGIRDDFPQYVVTLDEFGMSRDGTKHHKIRDFLLAKEWN